MESLKSHLQMKDREQILMTKQIRALHEDNERIVTMYKQVQQTPSKGTRDEVNEAPIYVSEYA